MSMSLHPNQVSHSLTYIQAEASQLELNGYRYDFSSEYITLYIIHYVCINHSTQTVAGERSFSTSQTNEPLLKPRLSLRRKPVQLTWLGRCMEHASNSLMMSKGTNQKLVKAHFAENVSTK